MQLKAVNIVACLLVLAVEYNFVSANGKLLRIAITMPNGTEPGYDPAKYPIKSKNAIYMSESSERTLATTRVACFIPESERDDKSLQWNKTTWDNAKNEPIKEVYCTSKDVGNNCDYKNSDGRLELVFNGFKHTDEANYTCSSSKNDWDNAAVEIFYQSKQAQTSLTVKPSQGPLGGETKDEPMKFTCDVVDSKYRVMKGIQWYYNNKLVEESERIEIQVDTEENKNSTLIIKNPSNKDAGVYMCVMKLAKEASPEEFIVARQWINVWSKGYVKKFEKESKNVMDGDDVSFCCIPAGHPSPSVHWERDGTPISEKENVDNRFRIKKGCKDMPNGLELSISQVNFEDKGKYECVAKNFYGSEKPVAVTLRVKDKLAALWPFLGIVVEVIILCTIIFLYERHQKRKQNADEDSGGEQNEQRQSLTGANKNVDGTNNSAATTKA